MTLPVLKVEIGFGYTAVDVITWTDVTAYVRGFSSKRGRSTELDSVQTGTCTILLNNRTRRFDPEYAAGPYAANLVNNVPVRVTCTHTAVTYPLFYGYVDGWPQTYEPVGDSTVALQCSDAFKLFNRWPLPESVWAWTVAQDDPTIWWRLGESDGDVATDSSGNGFDGVYNEPSFTAGLVDGSNDGAVDLYYLGSSTPGGPSVQVFNPAAQITDTPFTIEMWVESHAYAPGYFVSYGGSDQFFISVGVDNYGTWSIRWAVPSVPNTMAVREAKRTSAGAFLNNTATPNDGKPHHLLISVDASNVVYMAFDGLGRSWTGSNIAASPPGVTTTQFMKVGAGGGVVAVGDDRMVIDEVLIYNTVALDYLDAPVHYQAGHLPWYGDNTGTRLGRVLDMIGWPAALRSIDTGETILDSATLGSRTVLDYCQQVAETEQGRLFMGPDGHMVFHQRDHDLALTSQATFTDDGSNVDYLTSGLRFSKDERFTFNEVTAQRDGGTPVTVSTGDPITVSKSITGLLVQTDAEVRNIAESFLWRYKTPVSRVDGWTVRPEKRPAKWPTVLGLEIGERVTLQRTPMKLGAQISKDFVIESVAWDFRPGDATVSYTGSPVDPTSYFVVGTSQAGGSDVIR